jgi:shikimate kinase
MSGAGKTTALDVLAGRGLTTVDTDYGDWVLPDGTWDEPRMDQLLADHRDIVVAGTVSNQVRFYDRFEHVVLLRAPDETLLDRVGMRTNNPYGREPDQRAETVGYTATVEPLLRRGATLELDGRRRPRDLADIIESLAAPAL